MLLYGTNATLEYVFINKTWACFCRGRYECDKDGESSKTIAIIRMINNRSIEVEIIGIRSTRGEALM